ncbi:MAG: hypothetical protein AAF636_25850 [Pseudomonadota bacterium]
MAALAVIGQLTAADLNLPVPLCDPEVYVNLVKTAPVARGEPGQKLGRILKALNT